MPATEPKAVPLRDPMVHDLHLRVGRLEQALQVDRTEIAIVKNDMKYLREKVDTIHSGINRILWAIGLSVIAVGTTFVLSGGLVIVQP